MKIVLSVKRSTFRQDDPLSVERDDAFRKVRPSILKRDKYTCQADGCGSQSKEGLEVHHRDDDHGNHDASNLITFCPLCHACHHIGFVGARRCGDLIYLDPALQVSQGALNALVRQLWVAERSSDQNLSMHAVGFLARLQKLRVAARRQLGTSDPSTLSDILLNLSKEEYARRATTLSGIYLLPLRQGFERHAQQAMSQTKATFPVGRWGETARKETLRWLAQPGQTLTDADLQDLLVSPPALP